MKRILIFQPSIGIYRTDIFNKIAGIFETKIYVEYLRSDFEIYDSAVELLNGKPNVLSKLIRIGSRQLYSGYWTAIREYSPDIILVSEFGVDAFAAILYKTLFRKDYKVVSLCDDSYQMLIDGADFSRFHKVMRKVISPLLDDIILVEPSAKDWYKAHYRKGIWFPIVSDEVRLRELYEKALPVSREYVRKYSLEGKIVFLYVGRLVAVKNLSKLITAFNKASILDSKLVIVGNGDTERELKELAGGNKNIIFTGRLTGDLLYAWYNIGDVLVLPSTIEPFGAVTNEALVGGCKVIISKNAGSRCLVEEGVNGYCINPYDENDILEKLKKCAMQFTNCDHNNSIKLRHSLMRRSFDFLSNSLIEKLTTM